MDCNHAKKAAHTVGKSELRASLCLALSHRGRFRYDQQMEILQQSKLSPARVNHVRDEALARRPQVVMSVCISNAKKNECAHFCSHCSNKNSSKGMHISSFARAIRNLRHLR